MPSCCGGSTCTCKVQAGVGVQITGAGTQANPFVISANSALVVADNARFDLTLAGSGTSGSPYVLSADYAPTSKLDDVPDVNASTPTNGQVLSWNTATSKWVPANPTTAPVASVNHDQSLNGDGSVGAPLAVVPDAARFLALRGANGVGLSDIGVNQLVRGFIDSVARDSADPVPDLNALSMLDSAPGRIDFWDGAQWRQVIDSFDQDVPVGGEFMALSGSYDGVSRLTHMIRQVNTSSDGSGNLEVLTAADLVGRSGVLSVQFQETGFLGWSAVLYPNVDRVQARAFKLTDGTPYATQVFTGVVDAWLY